MKTTPYLIILIVLAAAATAQTLKQEQTKIEYTEYTMSTTTGNQTNLVLFSNQEFLKEDNQWKHITEAKSLQNSSYLYSVHYLDNGYPIEVLDWNWTHVTVRTSPTLLQSFTTVPLRLYSEVKNTTALSYDTQRNLLVEYNVSYLIPTSKTLTLPRQIDYLISYGKSSSLLQLNDSSINKDTFVDEETPDTPHGTEQSFESEVDRDPQYKNVLIEFDITKIPNEATITSANLSIYNYLNDLDDKADDYFTVCTHALNSSYSWTEADCDWNNGPEISGSHYNLTQTDCNLYTGSGGDDPNGAEWVVFDVTNIVVQHDNNSQSASGIYIKSVNGSGGTSLNNDPVHFRSSEYTNQIYRPKLNITYYGGVSDPCEADEASDWIISLQCNLSQTSYNFGTNIINITTGGRLNMSDGTNITTSQLIGLPQTIPILLMDTTSKLNIT